jgi:hypothetical protein
MPDFALLQAPTKTGAGFPAPVFVGAVRNAVVME